LEVKVIRGYIEMMDLHGMLGNKESYSKYRKAIRDHFKITGYYRTHTLDQYIELKRNNLTF